jgi:peptidyl-prolyl cis-trans isomerase D
MANNRSVTSKVVTKKHLAKKEKEARQTKIILISTIVILGVIVGLVGYGLVDNYIVKPNKIIAHVGDKVIKAGEFEKEVKYYRLSMINQAYTYIQYSSMFGDYGSSFLTQAQDMVTHLYDQEAVGKAVLDQMIDRIIMDEEAEKDGISVSLAEIQGAKQAGFDFYPDGTPTPTITPTQVFTPTLSNSQLDLLNYTATPTYSATSTQEIVSGNPTNTPDPTLDATEVPVSTKIQEVVSTSQGTDAATFASETPLPTATITPTPTAYTTQGFGKEYNNYLDTLSSINFKAKDVDRLFYYQILQAKLLAKITEDLKPFEDQVWARHILVATEEEAISALNRLNAGEDFAVLAAEISIDSGSAASGGDLGWFGRNRMVTEFEEAAFALNEGEISQPVKTTNGWHIIQLIGKGNIALNAAEFENYKQTFYANWIASIREARNDIVIESNYVDYVPTTPEVPESILTSIYSQ